MSDCRSTSVVASTMFTCGREQGHDGAHRAISAAKFSVADVFFPGRGSTEVTVTWDAPVELDAAAARKYDIDPASLQQRFGLPVKDGAS